MTWRLSIERYCNKKMCDDSRYTERKRGLALVQVIDAPMEAAPPITINDP